MKFGINPNIKLKNSIISNGVFLYFKINHQPSTINHQPSTINNQPLTINHQN